jgi:hypothetical protein
MKRFILIAALSPLLIGLVLGTADEGTEGRIPFQKIDHLIVVKAKIDDSRNDYNFIVDTGGLAMIDKAVVQELGLKQRGPMAKITTLDLSGYRIENVFCYTTFDFGLMRRMGTPVHGIIGSNLLERYKVTFDFRSSAVIFSTDATALPTPDNGLFFKFRNHPVNNAPIIKFKVHQKTVEGMIDTGQPYSVVLPFKDYGQYETSDLSVSIRSKGLMIKWPQTAPQHNYLARLKSCEFGDLVIPEALCLFGELPPMLSMPLIGTNLLSQFKMTIDYPKDELILIPYPDAHFENNRLSLGLNLNLSEKNEIWVEGIWENSSADKAEIHVGDRIVAFNSKKATPENLIELMEMMDDDRISSITLTIRNQKGERTLKLDKTRLF